MMFRNIRHAIRQLIRNRVFSLINILGLSVALLAVISILKHVAYERSFDQFHDGMEDVFRLSVSYTDLTGTYGEYPGISNVIGPKLKAEIPEISEAVRVFPLTETMRHSIISANSGVNPVQFDIQGMLAMDAGAFDLFSFEITNGTPSVFSSIISSVALNESTAAKLFGEEYPIGQIIKLNGNTEFIVSSVFKDWPATSHLHPEIVVQMKYMEDLDVARPNLHFLGGDKYYTYLKIASISKEILSQKFSDFVGRNIREQDSEDAQLHIMPFDEIHLGSSALISDMADVKNGRTLNLLILLAALILLMAWFNYINLSASSTLNRSKEVAIRRIHGAGRYTVFLQLLSETVLVVILASGFALTFDQFVSSNISGILGQGQIGDLLANALLMKSLLVFMILGTLISAAYPVVILSAFKTSELIKGKLKLSDKTSWLKKSLLIFQYVITIGLVFGTITVIQQIKHIKSIETKAALDKVLVLKGPGVRNPEFKSFRDGIKLLRNELRKLPGIESVATSNVVPGIKMDYSANLNNPAIHGNRPNYIKRIFADESFIDVFNIQLTAGRFFDKEAETDIESRPIVVNESAALELGFDPPMNIVNETLDYWGEPIKIIGVVEDFRMESADMPIESMFFFPTYDTKYFSLRLSNQQPADLMVLIKEKWDTIYPGNPFDFFYAETFFNQQYGSFEQFEEQLLILTFLSLSVAGLGLFALAYDTARTSVKEVGVRKVLGAGAMAILQLFISHYVRLIFLSAIISIPIVYYFLRDWLNNYASKISIYPALFIWPVLGVMLLAVTVISLQTLKTARMNPVESLRQE